MQFTYFTKPQPRNGELAVALVLRAHNACALTCWRQGNSRWSYEVGWPDWMLSAGLLIGLAGAALTLREVKRKLWPAHEQPQPRSARYVEGIGVLVSQAVIFGGMATMQFGTIAEHISNNSRPANLGLSLIGSAAIVLLFGFQLGRLAMRWQVQRLLAELDAESGGIPLRA
jgi:hypothetical protein